MCFFTNLNQEKPHRDSYLRGKKGVFFRYQCNFKIASGVPTFFFPFFFLVSIPFVIFALLFNLLRSRNSDPGSHSRPFSPPLHFGSCLSFYREKTSALSSLVAQRRIASNSWFGRKGCVYRDSCTGAHSIQNLR